MTLTSEPAAAQAAARGRRTGKHWIDDWRPEDKQFWENGGKQVARRNLIWSIFAEHLGFSVWLIWSVSSAFLVAQGFAFTPQQLFFLVAVPNLVGALIRLPYTFAVPKFGGRNWTMISAALLLIPTLLFAYVVQQPGTPYWVFCVIAATAGLGGGNFASSMANINFFYPSAKKGAALGLNAAGGNLGVALIQLLLLPVIVGGAGIFGIVKASEGGIHLERAAYVYAALSIVAVVAAALSMNNLTSAVSKPREQLQVVKNPQTWVMSFLYIGTFGSFIGYSAAMPLLIKLNFWRQPIPAVPGIGINFVYYAFLGDHRGPGEAEPLRLLRQRSRCPGPAHHVSRGARPAGPGRLRRAGLPRRDDSRRSAPVSVDQERVTWTTVCHLDNIEVEGGVAALVGGEAVAVFRTYDDEVYALSNYDPIGRASVLSRGIVGTRSVDGADVPFVASPLHKQAYDLRSGVCLDSPGGEVVRVPTYDATISDGLVLVGPMVRP